MFDVRAACPGVPGQLLHGELRDWGNSKMILALAYCFIQANVAIWSFLGDYWFPATTKDITPGFEESKITSTASAKEGKVVWWRKQMVCNKIDWVFAVASC